VDYIRIKSITEADFDIVITSAGGLRIADEGSADYQFREAIIELKLVFEEGFEKTERQKKLAALFRETQPNQPVVLINHKKLNELESRNYYRIVEVPIKNACKKASKQLQNTASRFNPMPVRVLIILNVGYTLLSPDEFKDVCIKCVHNDTSGIDWLVCGGIYFYSDKADNYVIARFEDFPINLARSFPSREILLDSWGKYLNKMMTYAVRNPESFSNGRMPVVDLAFELNGVRYVKTAPSMRSKFWPGGFAPRNNTSGIEHCPAVAVTFPSLSEHDWKCFKDAMPTETRLKTSYKEWLQFCPDEANEVSDPLKPLLLLEVKFDEFARWISKPKEQWQFSDINYFAHEILTQKALPLLESAKDKEKSQILPLDYILLVLNEVGTDKANDFASIYYVSEVVGFEREEVLVENAKIFFEHGMAIAASHAIKRKVNSLFYMKRKAF
jgi:hypothetical protein